MPRIRRRSDKGFSVLEMVVVTGLFLVIAAGLMITFLTGQTSYVTTDAYLQVQQEARRAFDNMVREVRAGGGTMTVAAGQLDFQMALGYNLALAGCVVNQVCWGAKDQNNTDRPGWNLRYRVSGTQLLREIFNGATEQAGERVLANYVDAAATSFAWNAGDRIVTMTFQGRYQNAKLAGGAQTIGPLTARVRLRNP
ncbi:MAG: hypothetical protein HY599_02235 [Candidatus Omnitrophica bacterium]|nr:hypothetical protein [Candidatus Omnitrophota bacterium]